MKQFESFGLDTANECLWCNGTQIALAPKPFAVLRYLVENPGRLITHDELLDALWPETYVQPQVLRTYMLELRKVLGDEAGQPRFIQTLPKRGYCFVAAVREQAGAGQTHASVSTVETVRAAGVIGRDAELACLQEQLQLVAAGQRRVVFVSGEAGIGKTALVDAFCRHVNSTLGAMISCGQCVQGVGCTEEYYPVIEALSHLCASADGEMVRRVLAAMAPAWLVQGRETKTTTRADGQSAKERLVGDLCAALEEIAAAKPLILVFEDMHWADDSTLNLISALARRRAQARLMLLATYTSRKAPVEHALKALKQDLLMHRLCAEIALTPLTKTAVAELLRRELGQETVPQELAEFVYKRSEGNPLFVFALLDHLIAERLIVRKGSNGEARWEQSAPAQEMDASVPGQLAQMIELEIERLSAKEQHILEAGSLMSVAFPAWAVAAALEMDATEAEETCDGMARRLYFVERAGQDELPDGTRSAFYAFAHGLHREVLYQRQAATRRAQRQIRIAERLGELFAGREASVAREMAMHYEAAGEWRRAAGALHSAARHALARHAFADAAELLEHALCVAENLGEAEREPTAREIRSELIMIKTRETLAKGTAPLANLS